VLSVERRAPSPRVSPASPGRGALGIVRDSSGRSVVSRAYATSPLRLLTPSNHGWGAWIYTSSHGGGLVDGDRIELDIGVGPGASAFVSTQASTKVYRSAQGTGMELHARIGADALLVLMPDPVVCFAASRYRQVQHFDLAPTADLVVVDWLSSGRHVCGERWAFDEYVAQLHARVEGTLVVHDSLALRADDGDVRERMGRFDVLAVALLLGPRMRGPSAELITRAGRIPVSRRAEELMAVTRVGDGCLIRVAGTSVERTGRTLRECVGFVPQLLGDEPWARKW
jgi:urease accessory protein